MKWISEAKRAGVGPVAQAIGPFKRRRGQSITPCPHCNAEQRGGSDSRGPVGFRDLGWACFKCDAKGDAVDFVAYHLYSKRCSDLSDDERDEVRKALAGAGFCRPRDGSATVTLNKRVRRVDDVIRLDPKPTKSSKPTKQSVFSWSDSLADDCRMALTTERGKHAYDYLTSVRKMSTSCIEEFGLGVLLVGKDTQGRPCRWSGGKVYAEYISIPVRDRSGKAVNIKFRSVPGPCGWCDAGGCKRCSNGEVRKFYCRSPGRPTTLFGIDRLSPDFGEPVIPVEGEFDVMAMWDYGYRENVVSGTAGAGTWDEKWLDILEPYLSFIFLYDDDDAGRKGASEVCEKLGTYRAAVAVLPANDAGECLAQGIGQELIDSAIENARPALKAGLVKAGVFSTRIEQLIDNPDLLRGRVTGSRGIDRCLGGWRPGLTVLTGDTGCGKTTLAVWFAYEQALRGIPVLITCFEQSPVGVTQKLLRLKLGRDFTTVTREERAQAFTELSDLPIHIVDHHGGMKASEVIDIVRYARRRMGVRWALLDHLGFMIDPKCQDERREIGEIVRNLSTVGVGDEMTICLICHPNRGHVAEQQRVTIKNLKGSSAIEQDCHVGLVVAKVKPSKKDPYPRSRVYFDKVRSEFGEAGSSTILAFDPGSCMYGDSWEETPAGAEGRKASLMVDGNESGSAGV